MEINRIKNLFNFAQDFDLLRREKKWSGKPSKFNRLKLEYIRSRTDQQDQFSEDNFNNLKIRG